MQIIRTIVWVFLITAFLFFAWANWNPVSVQLGPQLYLTTKLPALILIAFFLGLLPVWALAKASRWRLSRRIATLENTLKATSITPPLATSTQLQAEAAADRNEP